MRRKRFVVLPDRGISSSAMQASVFKEQGANALKTLMDEQIGRFSMTTEAGVGDATTDARVGGAAALSAEIEENDFEVVSQRFEDGPAVVLMTPAARMALEANHPGVRVVPLTRYYLPGRGRTSGKGQAASQPAATRAVKDDGSIYFDDAKQSALQAVGGAGGEGVVIGVLDTGVDATHPALKEAVLLHRCLVPGADPSAAGPVEWGPNYAKDAGHGTHVAGIIAGRPGHGGPQGVAPEAVVYSYRVFPDSSTKPPGADNAVIIDAIRAGIEDGCHILNLSLEGASLRDDGVQTAILDAWEQGVVCVAAAGNGFGNPVSYPAALTRCVAVTATGQVGTFPDEQHFKKHASDLTAETDETIYLARFSNFGPQVQFTAPGHAIVSTFPQNGWWFNSGTSMAAPFVAAILARYLSANTNIRDAFGSADRSAAMIQMLIGRAKRLGLPQLYHEGFGLPS